jgi:serine/threonine-protein kinase ATR
MLLDHLNRWVRKIRQDRKEVLKEAKENQKNNRTGTKRHRGSTIEFDEQLLKVDSILSSIDQDLMGNAALKCRAYARSLMSFENCIRSLREGNPNHKDLPAYYERLHEVYAHLDEPDGMEGISNMILSPSLEHQIRHHETSGRWTSAQSCWEVKLQKDPDSLESHLGLLRCLRNLGHYGKSLSFCDGHKILMSLDRYITHSCARRPQQESSMARCFSRLSSRKCLVGGCMG